MAVEFPEETGDSAIAVSRLNKPRPERKAIKCVLPPLHPDFDSSRFSAEEIVDLLQFEIKEVQAALRKSEDRVCVLERLLRQHSIPLPGVTMTSIDPGELSTAQGDDVPQRSARRRRGSVSAGKETPEKSYLPKVMKNTTDLREFLVHDNITSTGNNNNDKRDSIASITSRGPIDALVGVPISLDFKSELTAAAALETVPVNENLPPQAPSPILKNFQLPTTQLLSLQSGHLLPTGDNTPLDNPSFKSVVSPLSEKEPGYFNFAAEYISPTLLQEELTTSICTPDVSTRQVNSTSVYTMSSYIKHASESSLSSQFKSDIPHLSDSFDIHSPIDSNRPPLEATKSRTESIRQRLEPTKSGEEIPQRLEETSQPFTAAEHSEVSTLGTRGSLRLSATKYDNSRDAKLALKILIQTPQVPRTPEEYSSIITPIVSHNDIITLNSAGDTSAPSPTQKTPKTRLHRDLFKISNAFSFGSSESVSNRTSGVPSFQVLSPSVEKEEIPLFIKPDDLHTVRIKVASTISVNARKSDDSNCTFSIADKETDKEMWRIRKSFSQIIAFDNEIRPVVEFFGLPVLPEKSMFSLATPSKVDQRLRLLQEYFNAIFMMPHIPQIVLFLICRYISLDCVNPLDDFKSGARKEGFLIRRYKGLGTTWKVRWCQIDGPALEIYELPGGALQEQIRLVGSQIGRQSSDVVAEERGYRHAFLIIESPRNNKISNSQNKHFFCAESDEERDSWIESMVEFTVNDPLQNTIAPSGRRIEHGFDKNSFSTNPYASNSGNPNNTTNVYDSGNNYGYDSGFNPAYNASLDESVPFEELKAREFETPREKERHKDKEQQKEQKEEKKMKKRSMFNFRSRALSNDLPKPDATVTQQPWQPQESMQMYLDQMNLHDEVAVRVFGQDLVEVFELSHHDFKGLQIPSVCFRCFDFLDQHGAIYEEGIFRLSGSASAIRQLKQKFSVSLDVDLFETQLAPDIHTVAGLLKAYLRELPLPVFGAETYAEIQQLFIENSGMVATSRIAIMLRDHLRLAPSVNPINYNFCVVIFGFLRSVVAQSSTNRMSLKNICIVFVPTLNISVEILSLCLVDYDCIFGDAEPTPDYNREVIDIQIPTF